MKSHITNEFGENLKILWICIFQGQVCANPCPYGSYGLECKEKCDCYNGAFCDHINGRCKCLPGFQGIKVIYQWNTICCNDKIMFENINSHKFEAPKSSILVSRAMSIWKMGNRMPPTVSLREWRNLWSDRWILQLQRYAYYLIITSGCM